MASHFLGFCVFSSFSRLFRDLFHNVFSFLKFFQGLSLRPQSLAWFNISTSSFVKWKSFNLLLNHPNKKKKLFIA